MSAIPAEGAAPRTVRRLRPGVAVTPLRGGLHLRGRRGSLTLEGSTALPALWSLLEGPLHTGGVEDLLSGTAADTPLRAALNTLLAQLAAHDLLTTAPTDVGDALAPVGAAAGAGPTGPTAPAGPTGSAVPAGSAAVARWLGASAAGPGGAGAALAGARAEVLAGDPGAPLARAAGRALVRGGLAVSYAADPDLPAGRVLLRALGAGPERAVAAALCGSGGYSTAEAGPAQLRSDAQALEARLGPARPGGRAGALVPLLAGAAAHRLLCAAAGLADPATEGGDDRLLPGIPAVLLADADPPRAEYRSWLGPDRLDADRRADLAPAATLGEALRRVAALCDARCGVLPEPLPGDLPQLPVPLAACALPAAATGPGGRLVGGAPRLDLARLEVFCRTAELLLGGDGCTVGATPGHARGRALRRAAALRPGPAAELPPVAAEHWAGHPQVRHWWTTLTARLGVDARLEVVRAAPGEEVYRAEVRRADGPPRLLGEAVEATAGDAAAYAALAAVTAVCAGTTGAVLPGRPAPSGGALAPLAAAGARTAPWEDRGWTGGWLADTAGREDAFQTALHRLTGPALPARRPVPTADRRLADTLRAFGFTVLSGPQEAR
ncbi:hypothetical protein [Streptomyces sp. NPDC091268]|uniref:hypothetical protein n=1 Tax=Streptomyces sp. NPDC091268 TaxID=3365979 RepID=UPI0038144F29